LAVEEGSMSPPEPLSWAASRESFTYESSVDEVTEGTSRAGQVVVFVVDQGPDTVTLSINVTQPREGRGRNVPMAVGLLGVTGLVTGVAAAKGRRGFKFGRLG
jgi:hypothetical protein